MCRKGITFAQNFEICAMNDIPSFNSLIVQSIKDNWLLDALTDYKGSTLQYHDVARKIEKLHIMMKAAGIEKGDRVAPIICKKFQETGNARKLINPSL